MKWFCSSWHFSSYLKIQLITFHFESVYCSQYNNTWCLTSCKSLLNFAHDSLPCSEVQMLHQKLYPIVFGTTIVAGLARYTCHFRGAVPPPNTTQVNGSVQQLHVVHVVVAQGVGFSELKQVVRSQHTISQPPINHPLKNDLPMLLQVWMSP